ncbi:TPA: hypothetical protein IU341_002719 [Enterococcus faecalis]|nr:hypothetical protein [Enterococcus faecalis]
MIIPTIFLIAMSTYNFKDVPKQGYPIFIVIIGIIIGIVILSCYLYFKISKKNRCIGLNRFNYKMILFSLSEVSVFGYSGIIVFAQFQQLNTYIRLLLIVLYYILLYKLVVIIIVTDTKKVLNDTYGFVLPVKKWQQGLSRFPARLIIFTIVGMQVYRITKSFFILSDINNITNFLYGVVGGFGVILGSFCVGLLPTTFFDGNEFIQGALIKKYSEEFRRTFFFDKEEWYRNK